MDYFSIFLGAAVGLLTKLVYDELRIPRLTIGEVVGPFLIMHESPKEAVILGKEKVEMSPKMYHTYRIRIYNEQKFLFNISSRNCTAWLELETSKESYQLRWVGNSFSLTINVGDYREVDLCARNIATGVILAPTEKGFFKPEPRIIGDGKKSLVGYIRITSENAKKVEKRIVISPTDSGYLEIEL